jgi:hypothetical protein
MKKDGVRRIIDDERIESTNYGQQIFQVFAMAFEVEFGEGRKVGTCERRQTCHIMMHDGCISCVV